MKTTTGQHELALVSPHDFTARMRTHWEVTLGMPTPPALVSVWTTMAEQFGKTGAFTSSHHGGHLDQLLETIYRGTRSEVHVHVQNIADLLIVNGMRPRIRGLSLRSQKK